MITIVKDEELIDHVKEYDVTLVSANLYATMNDGFPSDVKKQYPYVEFENINTKYGDYERLGTILEASYENLPTFCLCFIIPQRDTRPDLKRDTLDYDSLKRCLRLINIKYKNKKIASTIMGSSRFDGNGNKDAILALFYEHLTDVDLTLYDFVEKSDSEKWGEAYKTGQKLKKTNPSKWEEFIKESKKKLTKKANESTVNFNKRPFKIDTVYPYKKRQRRSLGN